MSHPRTIPSNGRVADASLRGTCRADRFVEPEVMQIGKPLVDLCRAPDGPRDRQLTLGAPVRLFEERNGWCFVQAVTDDYVGYVKRCAITPFVPATHKVAATLTHLYEGPKVQAKDIAILPFGAKLTIDSSEGDFARSGSGYVPAQHLAPISSAFDDPVEVASRFLGTPYLWGGNSALGIDCSGLVQLAHQACAIACPADADMQQQAMGEELSKQAELRRGDLLFWRGHVAIMWDDRTIIHANGHMMAVTREPLHQALRRIESSEYGELLSRRRVNLSN